MRLALPLLLALCAASTPGLHAQGRLDVDASKRNDQLAPTPDSSDTPLSPQRETNQRTFFRNDHVQDQRFSTPDQIERKDAAVGDKRAPIDVTETREKTMVDRKDFPKPEVREREMNRHDGEKARIQPEGDQIRTFDKVTKYQSRMVDADNTKFRHQTVLEKRTTFDKINRFIFRRNGPGSDEGKPVVTPAAGGPPPPSQDTYTKYRVDWKRLDEAK
jgi:hypothetical protein